jgi:hypothetical protein
MNAAFLHLAVNHVPVVGLPLVFLLLAAAVARRSRELAGAGFVGLALMAVASFAAFKTGGPAHHLLDALPGTPHDVIREHARAANWGWYESLVLGLLGLAGLRALRRAQKFPRGLTIAAAVGALFVSTVMARVAHLGGLIRHPEAAIGYQPPPSAPDHDDDHDDDHDHDHEHPAAAPHRE